MKSRLCVAAVGLGDTGAILGDGLSTADAAALAGASGATVTMGDAVGSGAGRVTGLSGTAGWRAASGCVVCAAGMAGWRVDKAR